MDLLVTDADIITMAAGAATATAMLVRDDRIVAAGPGNRCTRRRRRTRGWCGWRVRPSFRD